MRVIGLTGGLGTGKTTVARLFGRLGAKVIDADAVARQLIGPKGACFRRVVNAFGDGILASGSIDRKRLADIVFSDKRKLRTLERIIHPEVRSIIKARIKKYGQRRQNAVIIIDVPLLFESGLDKLVDLTVVVRASRSVQLVRATKQMNITKVDALRRIKAQWPLRKKIRLADMIIDNDKSLTNTNKQVKQLWEKL